MKLYLIVTLLLLLFPTPSWSLDTTMELGVRGGQDSSDDHQDLAAGEIYYLQTLPWQAELNPRTKLSTRLDVGAAYLRADSRSGGWLLVWMPSSV